MIRGERGFRRIARRVKQRLTVLAIVAAVAWLAMSLIACAAPAPTVAVVASAPSIRDIQRIGINLGGRAFWGTSQYRQNVLQNPGFEPSLSGRIVLAKNPTASAFDDDVQYFNYPANWYDGARFEDVYSSAKGNVGGYGTIVGYEPAAGAGGAPRFRYKAGFTVAPGDALAFHQSGPLPGYTGFGPVEGWWIPNDPAFQTARDHEPESGGVQSLQVNLDGATHAFDSYLDSSGGARNYLPLIGRWRFSIWAKAAGAVAPSIAVTFSRVGVATPLNETITPGGEWKKYSFDFEGSDSAATPVDPLQLHIAVSGASGNVRLDDAFLGPAAGIGGWRTQVVSVLRSMRPGYIRDNQGAQGDDFANRIADGSARMPTHVSGAGAGAWLYSIGDQLALSAEVGARPWLVIPVVMADDEYAALGRYLARQQAHYKFPELLIEFGNENWNGVSCGGVCFSFGNVSMYTTVASRAFALMRNAAGPAANLRFVGAGQYVATGQMSQVASGFGPHADYVASAPYSLGCLDTGLGIAAGERKLWRDPWASESLFMTPIVKALAAGQRSITYESNFTTLGGNASERERNQIIAGGGGAGAYAQTILREMDAGTVIQMAWVLSELQIGTISSSPYSDYYGDCKLAPPNSYAYLFGIVHDLDRPLIRPTGFAVAMLNDFAIRGDYYRVDTGAYKNVSAGAFLDVAGWRLALTNGNDSPLTVTVQFGAGHPLPDRAREVAYASPADENESQPLVTIRQGPQIGADDRTHRVTLTLPAYSVVVAFPHNAS